MTTPGVAERAGLPHGAVSYHFRGKQELLIESALHSFADALPEETFARMTSLDDMLGLIRAELGDPEAIDSVVSRLMMETLREAERDPALRDRMSRLMGHYRALIADLVRREQEQGHVSGEIPPDGFATLLAAVGDGLLLHALLDPDLDAPGALEALDVLVRSSYEPA